MQIEITAASEGSFPTFQRQVFLFLGNNSLKKVNAYKFYLAFFFKCVDSVSEQLRICGGQQA